MAPKRVADDQLLLFQNRKKAKFTATGKPICDRCHKVVYEGHLNEWVNGRYRHRECWPAFMAAYRSFQVASYSHWDRALDKLAETGMNLRRKEYIMRQVNCVSKGVRDALMHRDRATPTICVALALVKR